jgi:hypothetical protein
MQRTSRKIFPALIISHFLEVCGVATRRNYILAQKGRIVDGGGPQALQIRPGSSESMEKSSLSVSRVQVDDLREKEG